MELGIETTIDGQIHQPGKIAIEAKLFLKSLENYRIMT